MPHRINLIAHYEGRVLDTAAYEVEGGAKLAWQLARRAGARVPTLVKIENRERVYPSVAAAHAASIAALKLSIDGGFA
ncbi:hypothetical protein WS51_18140 [Burkholderia territorii]|uniref:hypothetical protein n=1 Tax=Burkholderia territorii TaxID=1503055 RepID=UPI000841D930|nr:hypothetical protein [Burkholderia territorii]AOI65525.1 hypothetical protein WS51_18140 [Burkholderia territorii]